MMVTTPAPSKLLAFLPSSPTAHTSTFTVSILIASLHASLLADVVSAFYFDKICLHTSTLTVV